MEEKDKKKEEEQEPKKEEEEVKEGGEELQKEIDELMQFSIKKEGEEKKEEKVEEKIEEKKEEKKEEPLKTEPPKEPPKAEPPKEEPTKDDPLTALRKSHEELLEKYNVLATSIAESRKEPPKKEEEEKPPEFKPESLGEIKVDEINFLEGVDFEDLKDNPKLFNQMMNKAITTAVDIFRNKMAEGVVNASVERSLLSVPKLVQKQYKEYSGLVKTVDKFYEDNEDLVPFKKTVAAATTEIHAKEPGLSLGEVLDKAAIEARKALGLEKKAMAKVEDPPLKEGDPAFAKAKGHKRGGGAEPELTGLKKDLAETLGL